MRKNLFWLSDEQWARIKQHLPTDVRGIDRVDDRRVISGIILFSRAAAAGAIVRPNTVLTQRSTTGSCGGQNGASGRTCSAGFP